MLNRDRLGRLFTNRTVRAACLVGVGGILASCSASGPQSPKFSEAEYGKSSPRVVASNRKVPDGGGRYMVGEPYRVAGKTYIPQDDPVGYTATGNASWYGNNFHGRKTANGEVYDMHDLSAAHPTLPLPSYVRVTNLSNGRSVMVRVNDRGPFTHNRVIDVSSQAASMLDFKRAGTAKVQVEYIGRARLDGKDGDMLMASYRGPGATPPRTMVASNDSRLPKPGVFTPGTKTRSTIDFSVADEGLAFGAEPVPATFSDPIAPLILQTGFVSSYAEPEPDRFTPAQAAATALAIGDEGAAFETTRPLPAPATIQVGTFSDPANAKRAAASLSQFGEVAVVEDTRDGKALRIVRVRTVNADSVLAAAGKLGLSGAFVVSPAK
jgi:rare lipoprotein A